MPIILEIVTPDSIAFSEEVEHVVVPTVNGKIDLLHFLKMNLSLQNMIGTKNGQNRNRYSTTFTC